jgi:Zn-dependent metalloprotease
MLQSVQQKGTPLQREMATRMIGLSDQVRDLRRSVLETVSRAKPVAGVQKQRQVHDAEHGSSLPGRLVRSEGDAPTNDLAVDEAYDGSGATFDLFQEVYQRNSIDAQGLALISTVHFQQGYDNAFWDGNQMVYGDGDEDLPENERLFNRFTAAIDIIGHELTHGVTQYEAQLVYSQQSGALNESFSDVFGSLVKQRTLAQMAEQADWIIGGGLLTPNVNGQGIRSMSAPGTAYDDPVLGKDPQPSHMNDYQNVPYDNGGVHINSGIPNHAFYMAAMELGGNAWEKLGMVWYVTLRDKLGPQSQFQDAAQLTYQTAGELYGVGGAEQSTVRTGWEAVGLSVEEGDSGGRPGCLPALLSLPALLFRKT